MAWSRRQRFAASAYCAPSPKLSPLKNFMSTHQGFGSGLLVFLGFRTPPTCATSAESKSSAFEGYNEFGPTKIRYAPIVSNGQHACSKTSDAVSRMWGTSSESIEVNGAFSRIF